MLTLKAISAHSIATSKVIARAATNDKIEPTK
jgi:hypothetical protein